MMISLKKLNPYLFLTLLCAILYLPGIATVPIMDRDSAHFAQASKQMLQTNNYFQIRFQQRTRFQKPPGINWLQALSVTMFSDQTSASVWPYRIPSALGGLLSVLFTFLFARRFVGERVALMASAILACSLLLVVESHLTVIDASLLSSVAFMQGALWVIYQGQQQGEPAHWRYALLFWLAMGYGFVLKGITPMVGFLSIASLSLADKNLRWLRGLHLGWGLPLFILTLAWVLLVNQAEGTNYLFKMIEKDLLPKLKGGHESHGAPPLTHLAILPLTFWPGSLFLWIALLRGVKFRRQLNERFLLCWIVPTWAVFELMPTKLPQYVLPTFPALALLASLAINHFSELAIRGKHLYFYRFLILLWLALSLLIALIFPILPHYLGVSPPWVAYGIAAVITCLGLLSTRWLWQNKLTHALLSTVLLSTLSYGLIYQFYLPSLKPLWITQRLVAELAEHRGLVSDQKPLVVVGYQEPSLVFSLNTWQVKHASVDQAITLASKTKPSLVVVEKNYLPRFKQLANEHHLNLKPVGLVEGLNYSKGKWLALTMFKVTQ